MWVLVATLLYLDGHQEIQRYEFTAPHASEMCHIKEADVTESLKQQAAKRGLRGYTIVTCHPETKQ